MLEAPRRMPTVPEPWPPQPSSASHLRQGREAPRGRAHNSAETPWQLSISIVKTRTEVAGISEPIARPPYAISGGQTSSHLLPTFIFCMASVQAAMTCRGAKVVGWPRA